MKKENKYFEDRNLKSCGCGWQKFRTVIKDKAYACVKCNTVKVVVDPRKLTKYDQAKLTRFNLQMQRRKDADHKILKEMTVKSQKKKIKKAKPKKRFWTPKFLKSKPKNVVVTPYPAIDKTKKTGDK
jgi:hypothetical protein